MLDVSQRYLKMLDRVLHPSVIINLDGDSYRLRDHHAAADNLRRAATGTRQPLHGSPARR
jgi:hypothetical protein